MATPVMFSITIQDQEYPLKHPEIVITIEQDLFTHHSFEVTVPYEVLEGRRDDGFFHNVPGNYCGKEIEISLTPFQPDQFSYQPLDFKGIITKIALTNEAGNLDRQFVLSGYGCSYLLEDGAQRRTFIKRNLREIFEDVLRPYSVNALSRILHQTQHQEIVKYTVQYDETPYSFLRRLANDYGEWFFYDGVSLILGSTHIRAMPPLNYLIENAEQQFTMSIDLQPSRFELNYSDYLEPTIYLDSSQGPDKALTQPDRYTALALQRSEQLFTHPAHTVVQDRHVRSPAELATAAKERKKSQASSLITLKGKGENLGFTVGRRVDVQAMGPMLAEPHGAAAQHPYGQYRLTKITHTMRENMYENQFEAIPASAEHPPTNPGVRRPQGVPELAEVCDVADPKHLGRVRVCYKWDSESLTGWIRVSTPYSGHGKGQLFTPEVGSEVLVGYEQGKPDFPVVLGNLFRPRNSDNATYTHGATRNEVKGFQTAGGNKITFHDTLGQERILISNGQPGKRETKLEISFADAGAGIVLKTTGNIKLEAAQTIELVAGGGISMRAPNITLGADNIGLRAQQQFVLESYTASISGTLSVGIQSRRLDLFAAGQAILNGVEGTVISGGRVDIN